MAWKQLNIVIVILSISSNVVRSQLQDERKNDSQVCYVQSGHTFHCEGQNLRRVPLISSNATTLHLESNVISHITTKSFRRYSPLANLHLDHNGITLLVPSWAINLPELRGMTLSNNRLTALHRNTFDGLLSLRNLNLKNNEIVRVWEGWCIGLTRVVNLDLSYNRLAAIEQSKWCSFPRLKVLDLSHNEITVLETRWSGGMRSLSILHLQNNLVREVHNQTFTSLYSLERLFLQNNLIENFGEGWSTDLNATHSIDLSHNRIEAIKGDLFQGMSRVTWIDLQESNIRILQNNSFRMMKRVEELILERNNIHEISTDTFKDLSSVLWLRLQNNDISVLQPGSFAGMKSLLRLSLQNNQIPVLQKGTFGGSSGLTHLYLSHNNISRIENCWGGNFEKLQYLDLSWNNITILGEQNFICDRGISAYCVNSSGIGQNADGTSSEKWIGLQTLILTGNPIGHGLAKGAFQGLPKLLHLLLDNCDVEVIASEQFIGLHSLRLLDVSFNKIVSLDSYQFQYLPSLMVVNAKHNFIASLGPDSLLGASLMYLDLRSNNIETIPSSAIRLDLADGIELHIANNPLLCDNRLTWIQQALSQGYIHHVDLPNVSTQNFYFRPAIADVSDAGCANLGMRLIDVRSGLLPPYVTTLPSSEASSTQHSTGLPSTPSTKSNTGEYMAITNSVVSDVTYITTSKTPQNADDDTRRSDSWLSKNQTIGYFVIISICLLILLTGKLMKCFACWRRCKESNSEGEKFERYHKIKKFNLHSMLSTPIPFENTTRNNSTSGKVEQTPVSVSPPLPLSVGLVSETERRQPPPPPPRRKVHTARDEPPPIPTRTPNQDKSPRTTTATCKPKVRHTYFRGENLEDSQAAPVLAEDAMEYFPNRFESFEDIYTNQPTNNGDYQCRETDLGSEGFGCNYNVLVTEAVVHGHWQHSDMDDSSLDTSSSGISGTSDRLQRRQFEDLRFLVDINSTDEETLGSSFNEGDMERTLDGEEPGQSDPDDCKSANTKTDHHA